MIYILDVAVRMKCQNRGLSFSIFFFRGGYGNRLNGTLEACKEGRCVMTDRVYRWWQLLLLISLALCLVRSCHSSDRTIDLLNGAHFLCHPNLLTFVCMRVRAGRYAYIMTVLDSIDLYYLVSSVIGPFPFFFSFLLCLAMTKRTLFFFLFSTSGTVNNLPILQIKMRHFNCQFSLLNILLGFIWPINLKFEFLFFTFTF